MAAVPQNLPKVRPFNVGTAARVVLRITGAVLGGYAFSAAAVAWLAVSLAALGMVRSEAVVLASMGGYLIYLGAVLWSFGVHSVWRLWGVLAGGTALLCALTYALPYAFARGLQAA
jgi:hypothetical protein